MKPAIFCALALAALTFSARVYRPSHPPPLKHPVAMIALEAFWSIPVAESGFNPNAISRDKQDRGMWQFRRQFDAARGLKNPFDVAESTELAAKEFQDHFADLGKIDLAITAHRRGLEGTKRHGVDREYIKRARGF